MGTERAPGVGAAEAPRHVAVRVRYLSAIREKTGVRTDDLHLEAGSTLAEVSRWLKDTYSLTVPAPDVMSTLNGQGWSQVPEGLATKLRDGDEIAIFPLLSGG